MRHVIIVVGFALAFSSLSAKPRQQPSAATPAVKTDVTDGGSVVTDLGYDIKVNKGSTLHRSFVTINDPACPAQLAAAGVNTKNASSNYRFIPIGTLVASESLTAFEVRFVLFDAFGGRLKTLSGTQVTNIPFPAPFSLSETGSWFASENEVSELLTVAAFVANVRTGAGKVWHFNDKKITDELARLNLKISVGALEPTSDKK